VEKFLEKELPEIDSSLIRVIEWRPSLDYYREDYVKLLSTVVEYIKRTQAVKRTTAAFGRRWIRNFFKNLKYLNQTLLYKTTDIPVIITGSGPSLEETLPVIQKMRENCLIIASSSSVLALSRAGIKSDIIIATDGGNWALWHLYSCFRNMAASPLAVNLCAALPSQFGKTPFLVINDGSFWQSIILHELAVPSIIIPQMGTVTASAAELALTLSAGNIYLAGMDLRLRDIRSHVRPYGFDSILFNRATRIAPVYSQAFARSSLIQGGGSMGIYSAWFKNKISQWPQRIFYLDKSHEKTAGGKKTGVFKAINSKDNSAFFPKRAKDCLLAALKNDEYSTNLKTELIPLLLPGEKEISETRLAKAIEEVCYGQI
jgi:hypothetical protein